MTRQQRLHTDCSTCGLSFCHIKLTTINIACSKRSDSGEQFEVKKAIKSRRGIFFALLFTSHRSPLSERLEQATINKKYLTEFEI